MRFHCKKKKALFGAKDSATKHFRKVSGPQCLSGRKTNDVNCRKLAQNNYKSHPSCIFMNPKLYNFRWLWSFHIVVGKRRSGTEKKNHVTYLEMFIDLVLHLKPKGKKQQPFCARIF